MRARSRPLAAPAPVPARDVAVSADRKRSMRTPSSAIPFVGTAGTRRIFRPTGDTRFPLRMLAAHDRRLCMPAAHYHVRYVPFVEPAVKQSPRGDRGSVSLWLVIFAFTTLALLVLVVDGGQTMNAKSRAADIAEQAARAAADDLNVGDLRTGAGTVQLGGGACDLRTGPAAQLVADYASGVPGATARLTGCTQSVTDVGGTPALTVTATVQLSVRPALPVPPFNTISATAQETAYLACGSADQREAC
jgi:Flp pilus assembly protein TadG